MISFYKRERWVVYFFFLFARPKRVNAYVPKFNIVLPQVFSSSVLFRMISGRFFAFFVLYSVFLMQTLVVFLKENIWKKSKIGFKKIWKHKINENISYQVINFKYKTTATLPDRRSRRELPPSWQVSARYLPGNVICIGSFFVDFTKILKRLPYAPNPVRVIFNNVGKKVITKDKQYSQIIIITFLSFHSLYGSSFFLALKVKSVSLQLIS